MHIARLARMALVIALVTPATASADGLFTPFIGSAMSQTTYGFSLAGMGREIIGFEFDLGYTPDFFAEEEPDSENNVLTLMGNLIVGAPGRIRPYAVGGLGVIRTRILKPADIIDFDRNDFGLTLGGGIMGFFGDSVGVRGDVRYIRSLQDGGEGILDFDLGTFDFWRASAGIVFSF